MTIYRLDVYDTSGTQRYQLIGQAEGGYLSHAYKRTVNAPGLLNVLLVGDHSLLSEIEPNWQIEVWRKPSDGIWGRELVTLFRRWDWTYQEQSLASLTCPGILTMLDWRAVLYPADVDSRTRFLSQPAETIAKTLVKYNATVDGTVLDGRRREAASGYPFTKLIVETDNETGETLSIYCAYKYLLGELKSLADIGGGDFDIVKLADDEWEFRWYEGQLGTDLTAEIVFSLERANMTSPQYYQDDTKNRTVAFVAGQGEGIDRETEVVEHSSYSAENDIELFVDARDVEEGETDALISRGNQKLKDYERVESFRFNTVQVPNASYGVNYSIGDLVTGINPRTKQSYVMKIQSVSVSEDRDGKETIQTEMRIA